MGGEEGIYGEHEESGRLALSLSTGGEGGAGGVAGGAGAEAGQLRLAAVEALLRRSLLLRLLGDLDNAAQDLLEVLQLDSECGPAVFWYAKILLEQGRRSEAGDFLRASINFHEPTRAEAHALLGSLQATKRPRPDFQQALQNLKAAASLRPQSRSIQATKAIIAAAAKLLGETRDSEAALALLDKTLSYLDQPARTEAPTGGLPLSPKQSERGGTILPPAPGAKPYTPRGDTAIQRPEAIGGAPLGGKNGKGGGGNTGAQSHAPGGAPHEGGGYLGGGEDDQ